MTEVLDGFDLCKKEGHIRTKVANPRMQALCGRCGRLRGPDEMERDLGAERRWVIEAAEVAQYVHDPVAVSVALNSCRDLRIGNGPWRNVSERDWILEAEEEAVDLGAYLTAALQEMGEGREDEDADTCRMLLKIALAASVTAFAALGEFRRTAS